MSKRGVVTEVSVTGYGWPDGMAPFNVGATLDYGIMWDQGWVKYPSAMGEIRLVSPGGGVDVTFRVIPENDNGPIEPDLTPPFHATHAEVMWVVNVFDEQADLTDPVAIAKAGHNQIRNSQMLPVVGVRLVGKGGEWHLLDDVDLDDQGEDDDG